MTIKQILSSFVSRFLVAFVAVTAVALYFIWQPYLNARQIVLAEIERREQNRKERLEAYNVLREVASPGGVAVGQVGGVKPYVEQVQKASEVIKETNLTPPPKLSPVRLSPIPGLKALIAAVNRRVEDPEFGQRYRRTGETLQRADALLTYHAAVMAALVSPLEYNPRVDMASFAPGSPDTAERLQRAKDGLARAQERLTLAAPLYPDEWLDDVITSLRTMELERQRLEETGDTGRWIVQVEELQKRIITNRTRFFTDEVALVLTDLEAIEGELLQILEEWMQIKETFFAD